MKMKKMLLSMAAVPLMVGSLSVSASADDGVNILNDVKVKGEIRPRYEYANAKKNNADTANAYTARTHLVVTGGLLGVENLTTTIGLQGVNNFGYTDYAPANTKGNVAYDKIVDPQGAMLSEASIDYKIDKTALHAGRSQINLDNQRFIGTVGWRQMERSYDTVYAANNSIKNLSLMAAYVYGFAGVNSVTTVDANTVLLHAAYTVMPELKITAYDYMIAAEKDALGGFGNDTYGLALTGKISVDMAKLNYRAEYAVQKDASMKLQDTTAAVAANRFKADANYMNLDVGANISGILAGINYEVLSGTDSADKTAFTTPLATGHKFNGWADKFLNTPAGGLADANLRIGYKAKGFGKVLAVYHSFTADKKMGGEDDLGTEIDAVYVNKVPNVKNLTGLVKFAAYSGGKVGGYTNDVTKAWVQLDYKF
jgi:hypothetical protein